ncbi:MAG TPA: hypothetical protein PK784_04535 [Tenuifilaceae bacterium]|nr:hypothetical protein [Tenuifilaceae bacterium]
MDNKVKSGKEILDDFFKGISEIENIDVEIANSLANLYHQGKFTDVNIKNELQKLRDKNANKD